MSFRVHRESIFLARRGRGDIKILSDLSRYARHAEKLLPIRLAIFCAAKGPLNESVLDEDC
jgi:hypothetical protein